METCKLFCETAWGINEIVFLGVPALFLLIAAYLMGSDENFDAEGAPLLIFGLALAAVWGVVLSTILVYATAIGVLLIVTFLLTYLAFKLGRKLAGL